MSSDNYYDSLTDRQFWDNYYPNKEPIMPFVAHWKNFVWVQIARKLEELGLEGKSILEVGGGDAALLCYLAKKHPTSTFAILDYSPVGCARALQRAKQEGVNLSVYEADLFHPPKETLGAFDIVISFGVVEHFPDLSAVLRAKKALVADSGLLFTLIPNLASPIYGLLCRYFSQEIFDLHIPYNLTLFTYL